MFSLACPTILNLSRKIQILNFRLLEDLHSLSKTKENSLEQLEMATNVDPIIGSRE